MNFDPQSGIFLPFGRPDDDTIYTYEGWRRYVAQEPLQKPRKLTRTQYKQLSDNDRTSYDEARRRYSMQFGPITTPDLRMAHARMWAQLESNLYAPAHTVKVGAVLDGYAGLGKTTIAKTFARKVEWHVVKAATFTTPEARDLFIPVVHVTLKGHTTPRGLAHSICTYLGITLRGRPTEQQLVDAICEAVRRHRILLFVVDDIHFLDHRNRGGQDIADHLKALMSLTGCSFLYIGIDCEKMGIFRDHGNDNPLASQTAARFLHQLVRPFSRTDAGWRALIHAVEKHLVLLNHPRNSLVELEAYLFRRTQGNLGSFMNLIQKGAFNAIGNGERLDQRALDNVQLDFKASMDDKEGE